MTVIDETRSCSSYQSTFNGSLSDFDLRRVPLTNPNLRQTRWNCFRFETFAENFVLPWTSFGSKFTKSENSNFVEFAWRFNCSRTITEFIKSFWRKSRSSNFLWSTFSTLVTSFEFFVNKMIGIVSRQKLKINVKIVISSRNEKCMLIWWKAKSN